MSIFGAIVTGRMVQTDFQNVDQTKFLINIPDPDSINHIVVFLTGAQPFPDGFGGSVYFCWPSPDAVGNWQLLGFISNTKPSAIFRISKHKTESTQLHAFSAHGFSSVAQLGISVEPLAQIQFQAPASGDATAATSQTEFCTKMAESLFNHLASYAGSVTVPTHPNENFFPLRALEQWYSNFRRRLEQNPNFWKAATS
ncbi:protein OPI10 homolog [Haemaphysalis longicornis]